MPMMRFSLMLPTGTLLTVIHLDAKRGTKGLILCVDSLSIERTSLAQDVSLQGLLAGIVSHLCIRLRSPPPKESDSPGQGYCERVLHLRARYVLRLSRQSLRGEHCFRRGTHVLLRLSCPYKR